MTRVSVAAARGPRSPSTVAWLVVAACIVPIAASAARGALALATGPATSVPAYAVRLCRRALCAADTPSTPGAIDLLLPDVAVLVAWLVAIVCAGVAIRTRRPGWITLPLAVVHAILTVLLWNPVAFALADGAWWGQLLVLAIFVIVIAATRLISRRAGAAGRA